MKISYDSRYNIGYVQFREKSGPVDTIRISDEVQIDLSPDGRIYGIELLNANEQLKSPLSVLTVSNEAIGKVQELPLG